MYNLTLTKAPEFEPMTLADIKAYLKINNNADTCAGLTIEESIPLSTKTPGTVNGASVSVVGYVATIELNAGTILATGKLNVKVQESNDNASWVDWYDFAEITPTNDVQTFAVEYTGDCIYIRTVGVLTLANGDYSVNVILNQGYVSEDDYLNSLIVAARTYCENFQNKAYITQTWEMSFDDFPPMIEISKGNLQTVDSIKYTDSSGLETELNPLDYCVSIRGLKGRIVPAYNKSWPTFVPYPLDAVVVKFTCGYDTVDSIPATLILAMKLLISHWYYNREIVKVGSVSDELKHSLSALLWQERLMNI